MQRRFQVVSWLIRTDRSSSLKTVLLDSHPPGRR
jgi:hypothetical protein